MYNILPKYKQFTIYALFYLAGTLLASLISINYSNSSLIFLVALIQLIILSIVSFLYQNKIIYYLSIAFFAFFLALFVYSHFEFTREPKFIYDTKYEIEGKIVSKPEVGISDQKVNIKIEKLNKQRSAPDIILVKVPRYPVLSYGDRFSFQAAIEKPGMIEDFDYGRYLRRYHIYGTVNQPANLEILNSKLSFADHFMRGLFSVSTAFESSLNKILPEPHASLAAGLILGLKKNISDDFSNALKITGLTHIIALSGFNITIIVALFESLLSGRLSKKQIFWFGLAFVLLFIIMTGAASSVVRAGIFSMLIIFGKTIGRRGNFTNILLLAALLMVAENPFVLRDDVGFQLSFLAFCGIVYISPVIKKYLETDRFNRAPKFILNSLPETLGAQIAVLPLLTVVFGRVSLISPLSNILVVWSVAPAMLMVFIVGLAGIVLYPLAQLIAVLAWIPLTYIIDMTTVLAKIPGASFEFGKNIWLLFILLYLLIVSALILIYHKFKLKLA